MDASTSRCRNWYIFSLRGFQGTLPQILHAKIYSNNPDIIKLVKELRDKVDEMFVALGADTMDEHHRRQCEEWDMLTSPKGGDI